MDKRLATAIQAAKAGGEVALRYFRSGLAVEYKGDSSPVTRADRESEQRIAEVLRSAFPDHGILGEEFGERDGGGARWIVDPIDGTKNFIRGIPYFASLVALEEEGEVTTGVIYAPAVDDLLYAQRGGGAFDSEGRLQVSDVETLSASTVVFGGLKAFRKRGLWASFEGLVDNSLRQRGFGDYFGHTFIARGQADVMVELDLKPWDVAPLKVIIEEAGGRFSDLKGKATIYGDGAVTSNGKVHDEVLRLMRTR